MRALTVKQREALQKIRAVRDITVERLKRDIQEIEWLAGSTPSEWVSVVTLTTVHHVRRRDIDALVQKGYLGERPSGGWGPEVRVNL